MTEYRQTLLSGALLLSVGALAAPNYAPTVQAENLDRGLVAVKMKTGGVFLSWRSLLDDAADASFDIYRDGVKLNETPVSSKTNFTDPSGTADSKYVVKTTAGGNIVETTPETQPWAELSKRIPMKRPEGGIFEGNSKLGDSKGSVTDEYEYTPNSVAVGDVDGDGKYEYIVKWAPTNYADNSFVWYTGKCYFDCYREDGTMLWRIDMGINIRSGNHYTQFLVYDFDGDGKAELMVKTAPGTIDGTGKPVVMGDDDPNADYRTAGKGTILKGPEYLTVFNGETGAEISTIAYNPPRNIRSDWGDSYGNRCERYLACAAYLDGKKPSAVFCRGYYTYAYLWAVDFDGKQLKERWLYESPKNGGAYNEGAHSITVGDVDADGCDEIIFGAAAIDHDGKLLYRTGGGHGDALHLGDFCPDREGLEVWMVFEEKKKWDAHMRDARTGEIIFSEPATKDNGRGVCANISSKYAGYEAWSQTGVMWAGGEAYTTLKVPDKNFRVYWDGDLLDELYEGKGDGPADAALKCNLTKVNNDISKVTTLVDFATLGACHSYLTKRVPLLQADIFGDWREEMVFFDKNNSSDLLIFTTTIPTQYKVTTLMQDRQYRLAAAWQNVAYHQPPHLGYNLEEAFNKDATISISGGAADQAVYHGDPIKEIGFSVKKASGATVEGLPEGLAWSFDNAALAGKIYGTPVAEGEYQFTISTTGAEGKNATLKGNILVNKRTGISKVASFSFEEVGPVVANGIFGEAKAYNGIEGTTAPGKVGNALQLDGTNCYVQDNYPEINFGFRSFTIEMWTNSSSTANCYILNKGIIGDNDGSGQWTGLEFKNSELRFAVDDRVTKSETKISSATGYFDGQWHHVVLVRNVEAKTLSIYIDGELKSQSPDNTGAINNPEEPLCIGNVNFSYNNFYKGLIDELNIYHGAMSASSVKKRFEDPTSEVAGLSQPSVVANGYRYTVVNAMSGTVVATAEAELHSDVTGNLPKGVYIMIVETPEGTKNYKFIR